MTTKLASLFIALSYPLAYSAMIGTSHLIESTLPTDSSNVFNLEENFESTDSTGFAFKSLGSNMFFYEIIRIY